MTREVLFSLLNGLSLNAGNEMIMMMMTKKMVVRVKFVKMKGEALYCLKSQWHSRVPS